ncbi:MAG TPA: response regulator transcription factor [Chthoniobacteraceae bacterium]|jgi:DNA-binding NarL/FixJ family response regulator
MRLLIIDDHKVVRRGLMSIIAEEYPDAIFAEAASSQAASEMIYASSWDLVLLDINIPGRSGLDVLAEIKAIAPETAVIVISAYPEEDFAVRALKLRAAAYLTKNCVADELLLAMRKALAGGRYVTVSLAEKLADALGSDLRAAPHESLSNRELQVLRLIAVGRSMKEVAAELTLSEKTIGTYRSRIAEKTGLSTGVELARYALQHRLVE